MRLPLAIIISRYPGPLVQNTVHRHRLYARTTVGRKFFARMRPGSHLRSLAACAPATLSAPSVAAQEWDENATYDRDVRPSVSQGAAAPFYEAVTDGGLALSEPSPSGTGDGLTREQLSFSPDDAAAPSAQSADASRDREALHSATTEGKPSTPRRQSGSTTLRKEIAAKAASMISEEARPSSPSAAPVHKKSAQTSLTPQPARTSPSAGPPVADTTKNQQAQADATEIPPAEQGSESLFSQIAQRSEGVAGESASASPGAADEFPSLASDSAASRAAMRRAGGSAVNAPAAGSVDLQKKSAEESLEASFISDAPSLSAPLARRAAEPEMITTPSVSGHGTMSSIPQDANAERTEDVGEPVSGPALKRSVETRSAARSESGLPVPASPLHDPSVPVAQSAEPGSVLRKVIETLASERAAAMSGDSGEQQEIEAQAAPANHAQADPQASAASAMPQAPGGERSAGERGSEPASAKSAGMQTVARSENAPPSATVARNLPKKTAFNPGVAALTPSSARTEPSETQQPTRNETAADASGAMAAFSASSPAQTEPVPPKTPAVPSEQTSVESGGSQPVVRSESASRASASSPLHGSSAPIARDAQPGEPVSVLRKVIEALALERAAMSKDSGEQPGSEGPAASGRMGSSSESAVPRSPADASVPPARTGQGETPLPPEASEFSTPSQAASGHRAPSGTGKGEAKSPGSGVVPMHEPVESTALPGQQVIETFIGRAARRVRLAAEAARADAVSENPNSERRPDAPDEQAGKFTARRPAPPAAKPETETERVMTGLFQETKGDRSPAAWLARLRGEPVPAQSVPTPAEASPSAGQGDKAARAERETAQTRPSVRAPGAQLRQADASPRPPAKPGGGNPERAPLTARSSAPRVFRGWLQKKSDDRPVAQPISPREIDARFTDEGSAAPLSQPAPLLQSGPGTSRDAGTSPQLASASVPDVDDVFDAVSPASPGNAVLNKSDPASAEQSVLRARGIRHAPGSARPEFPRQKTSDARSAVKAQRTVTTEERADDPERGSEIPRRASDFLGSETVPGAGKSAHEEEMPGRTAPPSMPQASMPQASMPQASMPQASMPQASMPQASMPQDRYWANVPAPWEPLPSFLLPETPRANGSAAIRRAGGSLETVYRQVDEQADSEDPPSAQRAAIGNAPPPLRAVPEADLDRLAKQVYETLKRRFAAERRRSGL